MKDFKRGVLFTIGLALFGAAMHEMGRRKEQHENAKRWHLIRVTIEESLKSKKEES